MDCTTTHRPWRDIHPEDVVNTSAVGVIDIGSNSTNLLIVGADGQDIERIITTTRLGRDVFITGELQEDAIALTVSVTNEYVSLCRQHGVQDIRIVGTAACRRASNVHLLQEKIRVSTGCELHVLHAEDEARLSFEGALVALPPHDGLSVVIDIGGGSTEFTVGVSEPDQVASINHGAVVITQRDFTSDPPPPAELTNAIGAVADDVEELTRSMPALLSSPRFVGTAGTFVTIAAVELGLMEFDNNQLHGMTLTRDAAEDVFRTLAIESLSERVHNPGLPRDRADIIVAGCCIVVAIMRRLHLSDITISTKGLLDGVARRAKM
jgi:exopolyphosphatase / guanosine-5'-triphosphate,3'-diphosphate pyrophosphatase